MSGQKLSLFPGGNNTIATDCQLVMIYTAKAVHNALPPPFVVLRYNRGKLLNPIVKREIIVPV